MPAKHSAATGPHWGVLRADGVLVKGQGAAKGVVDLFADGEAGVLFYLGKSPIYFASSVDLLWTVTKALGSTGEDRAWGLEVPVGSRVWLFASQHDYAIGIGKTLEAVEEAVLMLHNSKKSETHGRDQQGGAR